MPRLTPALIPAAQNSPRAGAAASTSGRNGGKQARNRASPVAMGYGYEWRKASREFLHENPLCAECQKRGRLRGAAVTDHVVPHKGDMALFWDRDNWQPLCWRCHSRKTAKEDGWWK